MVAFGEDLPVLQVSDAVLDSGAETGDCFVESFLPATSGLIGGFLDRSYRGGRGVGTVSNPCGLCLRKKVTPPTLLDYPGIMTSSWERLGHRHEVAPAGGRDLHGSHIGLYVSRSRFAAPCPLAGRFPVGT